MLARDRSLATARHRTIAMTALRGAAPASGGFGPDRSGRAPSFAMASSSASTSSTNTSTPAMLLTSIPRAGTRSPPA